MEGAVRSFEGESFLLFKAGRSNTGLHRDERVNTPGCVSPFPSLSSALPKRSESSTEEDEEEEEVQ